ncbi:MAG: hypothetical protein V7603_336 [Micromonosporaceae bacterium]
MPGAENQDGGRVRPHTATFWTGVGVASLAALLVLFSNGTQALRVAAILAILAVVLVGLAIMMRPDARSVRAELEESVFEEIDGLRADIREDISSAARATHKSFSDKLQNLYEHVDALRGQLDAARGQLDSVRREYESAPAKGAAQVSQAGRAAPVSSSPRPVGTAMVGGGVVRHTETVQVTRSTVVDPQASDNRSRVYGTGSVYGQRGGAPADATTGRRRADRDDRSERTGRADWEAPREESWTEQRLRDRLRDTGSQLFGDPGRFTGSGSSGNGYDTAGHRAPAQDDYGRGRGGSHAEHEEYGHRVRSHSRDEREDDVPAEPWSGLRAGDRWAAVRSDERGRELRMGERRAAVHSDQTGTELRIEDRWAAVRREDDARRGETRRERREREEHWSGGSDDRWSEAGAARGRHTGSQPALPASDGYGPSWTRDWREDTAGGHRERVDRWEREEMPRPVSGARARRLDFELTDDRWR